LVSAHPCWHFVATNVLLPVRQYINEKRKLSEAQERQSPSAPTSDSLKRMVECAFWASLRPEEGRYPKFSIIYAQEDECADALKFKSPKAFLPEVLAALAPALSRNNSRFAVAKAARTNNIIIWGVAQEYPIGCLEVRVLRPGRIMIQANGERLALLDKETTYCLLRRRHWDQRLEGPLLFQLAETLGRSISGRSGTIRSKVLGTMLLQIIEAMHGHGHGGALIVVPQKSSGWETSISLTHKLSPFDGLSHHFHRLVREVDTGPKLVPSDLQSYLLGERWKMDRRLIRLVETLGALTAVDGATIVSDTLDVLGFGAKLQVRPNAAWGKPLVRSVLDSLRNHEWDRREHECEFRELGGTRHQSAAFLVAKHRDLVGIVASQDGGLSIVAYHPNLDRVTVTRRVEMLLE